MNDPVFGWLQDAGTDNDVIKRRTRVVGVGGMLWAVAFASVWFPPTTASSEWRLVHFVLTTCAYDGMLTLVEVAHSAMLAELAVDDAERAQLNGYAAAFAGLGSLTSFVGQWYWNMEDLFMFRFACLGIAAGAAGVFVMSAAVLNGSSGEAKSSQIKSAETAVVVSNMHPIKFLKELNEQRNFFVFAGVASLQSLDCGFEKSSFTMFLAALAGNAISRSTKASIVSLSFFLPWLGAFLVTPIVKRFGVYEVLNSVFFSRFVMCSGALLFFVSRGDNRKQDLFALVAVGFLLCNRVMSEAVCRINPLVVSDLIDEDRWIHHRSPNETRSGSIVGTNNFFAKLAQSVGPMIGFALLSEDDRFAKLDVFLAAIPLICVSLQLYLWNWQFNLFGDRLKKAKEYVQARKKQLEV